MGPDRDAVPTTDPAAVRRDDDRMPRWVPRLLLLIVLTYFGALLALSAFRALRDLILWLIAALFLSFALEPAVNWLVARGWRRGVATALVLLSLGLIGLVAVAAMVPLVFDQVQELITKVPQWLERVSVYTKRWFDVELTGEKIFAQIASAQQDVSAIASKRLPSDVSIGPASRSRNATRSAPTRPAAFACCSIRYRL